MNRLPVEYDASLVEEAVFRAIMRLPRAEQLRYHRERERGYAVTDPDAREAQFRELGARWFRVLGFHRPLERALGDRPLLQRAVTIVRVAPAGSRAEEHADLCREPAGGAGSRLVLLTRVLPQTLLDEEAALAFFRHEALHAADMLDPAFGYRRSLPPSEAGAAYDHLLRNRYRAVWDATIDGRLVRAGLRPASVREERLLDFRRAFPGLAERASQEFSRWFDAPRATHDQIVEFITAPTRSFERGSGVCPVCRLPVAEALVDAAQLSAAVRHVIESARPGWSPDEGICRQCADLYMAQHMPAIQC